MVRLSDLVRNVHQEGVAPPASEAAPPEGDASRSQTSFPREAAAPPAPTASPEPAQAPEDSEAEAREAPEELFAEVLAFTGRLPALLREGKEFPWGGYQGLLERVIRSLKQSADLFWLANNPPGAEYLPAHLASVGILSLGIGAGLRLGPAPLLDLGMAAFLFDVGIAALPPSVLAKGEARAGDDLTTYQAHAQLSADLVRRCVPPRTGVIEAVLQHHERENGQGYPQGLAGAAIHPNAKIIGLLDTYVALIFPRPPVPRLPPYEAVRQLVRSKREEFPAPLIKALLAEISVFPPRTMVKLNTGEVGRVIAVNRNYPLRPRVEIFSDSKGSRLMVPRVLNLPEAPFIYVTGAVEEGGR